VKEGSAPGQKRTSHQFRVMSALPPKADIHRVTSPCPLCAISDQSAPQQIGSLFDHLVDLCHKRTPAPQQTLWVAKNTIANFIEKANRQPIRVRREATNNCLVKDNERQQNKRSKAGDR
jgi:hypothetical protein